MLLKSLETQYAPPCYPSPSSSATQAKQRNSPVTPAVTSETRWPGTKRKLQPPSCAGYESKIGKSLPRRCYCRVLTLKYQTETTRPSSSSRLHRHICLKQRRSCKTCQNTSDQKFCSLDYRPRASWAATCPTRQQPGRGPQSQSFVMTPATEDH